MLNLRFTCCASVCVHWSYNCCIYIIRNVSSLRCFSPNNKYVGWNVWARLGAGSMTYGHYECFDIRQWIFKSISYKYFIYFWDNLFLLTQNETLCNKQQIEKHIRTVSQNTFNHTFIYHDKRNMYILFFWSLLRW